MRILLSILLLCLLVMPALRGQEAQKASPPANANKTAETPQKSVAEPDYKIGPQDVLRIDVWKEPDFTRTVPVRPDGKVSLPLLNDVQAAGLTPTELASFLKESLKKYLTDPQVTVTMVEVNSRRVYVTGEVAHTGAMPLLPNMTVLQALTSSGGFTQFARIKGIYVLRLEDGKQVKHPFNYKEVIKGNKPEDNIQLQSGDIIVVP